MRSHKTRLAGMAVAASLMLCAQAQAHPHIWIETEGDFIFSNSHLVAIRHHWTFDPLFTAWAVQGLDENGDGIYSSGELQDLAETNLEGLIDYNYYSFAQSNGTPMRFSGARAPSMHYVDDKITLSFTADLLAPMPVNGVLDIEIFDPEYFMAYSFKSESAFKLIDAPDACTVVSKSPEPLDPEVEERLFSLPQDVTELPADLVDAARSLANLATITCPLGVSATALDAVNAVAQNSPRAAPFSAPPSEPGFSPDAGGIVGWIATVQKQFYQAITNALTSLKKDNSAFWVLGGLSFLYGIFHAAGPGHGKVIISSYMLANERDLKLGLALSWASALMQALVAIGFVLILAGVLRLTAASMSIAANWLIVSSYAAIAVLGAWLLWVKGRKFLRVVGVIGGRDHADHNHSHGDNHEHGGDCVHVGCSHIVDVEKARVHGWREALGVIFSVGIRPCSGALVVMTFAMSQNLLPAGIFATLAMAMGTAITVSALAIIAVLAKSLAASWTRGAIGGGKLMASIEVLAASFVFLFGLLFTWAALQQNLVV